MGMGFTTTKLAQLLCCVVFSLSILTLTLSILYDELSIPLRSRNLVVGFVEAQAAGKAEKSEKPEKVPKTQKNTPEKAELFWENSFKEPFVELDTDLGKRLVDDYWEHGGHAAVRESFVRLTPDRQSKRGYVYNTNYLRKGDWSAYFRFRVSGKGKTLFGDGLALWLEQDEAKEFEPGPLLGHADTFVGIGIAFDTFRNAEAGHVHKDISLLTGDGKTPATLDTDRPGCDRDFRYWEGRDDFDADSESAARITLRGYTLTVEIDPNGSNAFEKCFSANIRDFDLPKNWRNKARFAISASTGQLADNHDVMEFAVARPDDLMRYKELTAEENARPPVEVDVTSRNLSPQKLSVHMNDLSYEVKSLDERIRSTRNQLDHQLQNVKNEITATLNKLQEQEENLEVRMREVEAKQEESLLQRVQTLERDLSVNFDKRLKAIEHRMQKGIANIESETRNWKFPLVFFLLVAIGVGIYLFWDVKKLKKKDSLHLG